MSEMNDFLAKIQEFFGEDAASAIDGFLSEMGGSLALLESRISEMQPGEKPANIDETLRAAHTLKGMTAQFGLPGMSRLVHRLEDSLIPIRDRGEAPTDSLIHLGLQVVDRLKAMLDRLLARDAEAVLSAPDLIALLENRGDPATAVVQPAILASTPAAVPASTEIASIQVPLELLDQLFNQLGRVSQDAQASAALSSQVNEALWTLVTARMLPPDSIVTRLRRTLRETLPKLGKRAKLVVSGETEPIDVSLVKELGEMLLHMVRNGLDHGLESPEERQRLGKDPEGILSLRFVKSPEMVRVELSDDGKGIDAARVAAKAIEKGIITSEENDRLTNYERIRLIFAPGFSTAAQVTEVSGRGVGMDVVLRSATKLGGSVEIESEPGQGTKFLLKFPVRYYCVPSLIGRMGEQYFAIGAENVERVLADPSLFRIEEGALVSGEYEGEMIPMIGFPDLDARIWEAERAAVIVFRFDGMRVGLAIDELLDARPAILAPLPPGAALPYLNSAVYDPDLGAVFGFNMDEVKRNWNSYMVPEKPGAVAGATLIQRVKDALNEEVCLRQLESMLTEISDPALRERTRDYFTEQRQDFLSVVEDVGEGDDLEMVLATRYVEQKAHWIQLNIQLQYQSIIKGEADPTVLCRASSLSFLLGQIEPLVDSRYLESINQLLNEKLAPQPAELLAA